MPVRRGGRTAGLLVRTVNSGVAALLKNPRTGRWIGKGDQAPITSSILLTPPLAASSFSNISRTAGSSS